MKSDKDIRLFKESKKLFNITIKEYLKYWLPIYLLSIIVIIMFYFYTIETFNYSSVSLVIAHTLNATIFLVIYDGIPARKIKKENFKYNQMSRDKGIVFYNALRLRTIFRGILNILSTLILLIIVVILIIL